MGFGNNHYAKLWKVEDKGKYFDVQLSISKKNKQTNNYETSFMGFVKFVGNAKLKNPQENQRIKITECDVENCFTDRQGKKQFLKNPKYVIFDYETADDTTTSSNSHSSDDVVVMRANRLEEIDAGQLPF